MDNEVKLQSCTQRCNQGAQLRFTQAILISIGLFISLFGCSDNFEGSSAHISGIKSAPVSPPVFASYVVCGAEFPDGQRYTHMLRITADLDVIEFTGGLGQRVFVAQTVTIKLPAGQLLASFAVAEGVSAFDLSIDRASLNYGLTYNAERADSSDGKVFVEGRCSILEGDGFKL